MHRILAAWLILTAVAAAQPVASISGPTVCDPGGWIKINYVATGGAATWVLLPYNSPHLFDDFGGARVFLASKQAGRCLLVLVVVDAQAQIAVAAHEIVIGPTPTPTPIPPGPGPTPPPDPNGTATHVVVVYDEGPLKPSVAETIAQLRKHFDDTAVKFFALDTGATDENGQKIANRYVDASGVQPPCAVVYGANGVVIWKGKLPATSQELIDHAR